MRRNSSEVDADAGTGGLLTRHPRQEAAEPRHEDVDQPVAMRRRHLTALDCAASTMRDHTCTTCCQWASHASASAGFRLTSRPLQLKTSTNDDQSRARCMLSSSMRGEVSRADECSVKSKSARRSFVALVHVLEHRDEQLFLRVEVVVDEPGHHAGGRGDHLVRRVVVAVIGEAGLGSGDDLRALGRCPRPRRRPPPERAVAAWWRRCPSAETAAPGRPGLAAVLPPAAIGRTVALSRRRGSLIGRRRRARRSVSAPYRFPPAGLTLPA